MIFVDTGAWYAAAMGESRVADACRDELEEHAGELATTDAVLTELSMLFVARRGEHLVEQTLTDIIASSNMLSPGPPDRRTAVEILRTWSDHPFSYTDALSFALMQREGITTALSLDQHFRVFRTGTGRTSHLDVRPSVE